MLATHLTNRALIRLSAQSHGSEAEEEDGEDVAAFLQGLITNDVSWERLAKAPIYAGLLSAQGKCEADFLVWADPLGDGAKGNSILIDCEAQAAEALIRRLSLYRLRRKINIAAAPDIEVHWAQEAGDDRFADPRLAQLGYRWLVPAEAVPEASEQSATDNNTPENSADQTWLAHRLALGVCEGAAELGQLLWLETNAADLNGVSFEKGCYIGQENTARMNWRNKVNRRLVVVPIDQSNPKRCKTTYPQLGLAVDHLRLEDIAPQFVPDWMQLEGAD